MINLSTYKENKGFMKYFKNTSWIFIDKFFRLSLSLVVGVWVARYLGPTQFGLLNYAIAFSTLFTVIAPLGLDDIVVRELVKNVVKEEDLLSTTFGLKIIGGLIVLILMVIAIGFTDDTHVTKLMILLIGVAPIFQSFKVIDLFFQSKVLSKYSVKASLLSQILSAVVRIILIIFKQPIIYFAFAILLENIILAIGLIYYYNYKKYKLKWLKIKKNTAKILLKDSWYLILSSLTIIIYMKIDQIMLKEMVNSNAVGQYAAAVRLSEVWYLIPTAICGSVFPAIINAKKQNDQLYYNRLQNLFDFLIWLALFVAIFMTFFSNTIVNLLYGDQYYESGNILKIHIWSAVFVFFGVANSRWMLVENLQKYRIILDGFGAALNILLNIFFIRSYGAEGAALATLLSYSLTMIIMFLVLKRFNILLKMFLVSLIKPIKLAIAIFN